MSKYDYDLVVIGGGAAGLTASTSSASMGAKTLLIEKESRLGGDCLHYGCVPSKSLIKSAYAYNVMREAQKYGLPEVDVPAINFKDVRDRIQTIIAKIQAHDSPEHIKEQYGVNTDFGNAEFVDNHTIELGGNKITARDFVIATGSSPVIPNIEGLNDIDYLTNLKIFSIDKLPTSLIVLGGGPIGLEMAQAFSRLGSKVTVVQSASQLLPKEDMDIGSFIKKKLENEGVKVYLNTRAVKVEKNGDRVKVSVTDKNDDKNFDIEASTLLVATGRKANVEDLNLEKAGVKYNPKGIDVDDRLRTNVKNIYACGDVNGGFQFTHVAGYEGGIAMVNSVMRLPAKTDYTKVPWVTYMDPEIASVGYNQKRAQDAGKDFVTIKEPLGQNDRALAESETDGFIKILADKNDYAIGVQIVGFHAGDLIHEWVAAINGKIKISTIANSIHAYPTLSEISKGASSNYIFPKMLEGVGGNLMKFVIKNVYQLKGNIK